MLRKSQFPLAAAFFRRRNALRAVAIGRTVVRQLKCKRRRPEQCRAAKGIRDPEIMLKACDPMDRLREEIRRKHGTLDIGVPAIRELRDGE